jgi:hypothetical protein
MGPLTSTIRMRTKWQVADEDALFVIELCRSISAINADVMILDDSAVPRINVNKKQHFSAVARDLPHLSVLNQ